jgi:hypothetical protein
MIANETTTENMEPVDSTNNRLNVNARNPSDTATTSTVGLNSATATTIAAANPDRKGLSITLEQGTSNVNAIIRYYPASTDNIKHGVDVLTRFGMGADSWFRSNHTMESNTPYTGEVSGIMSSGSTNVFVTEY